MYEYSELLIVDGYQYIPTFINTFYFRNDITFYSYV